MKTGVNLKWIDPTAVFVPPHRTTTAHIQAAYPLMFSQGLGSRGTYIGRELLGGSFCHDPCARNVDQPKHVSNWSSWSWKIFTC